MEYENKRIDVIIPAYHAQDTILRTLSSIAAQKILSEIDVTIVNDADEIGYQKFIDTFSPYMSIREIKMEINGGPGVARQYGLDNTKNNYLTFIDADDTFAGAFALKFLRDNLVADPKSHMCVGVFIEEHPNNYLAHQTDMVWMFGKMYTRPFLDRNKIRFHPTSRANEDNGFNTLIKLLSNENQQIKFIQDVVYYWHERENSITRVNNCEYSFNQSFTGYAENMIYAITEAKKRNPFNGAINLFAVEVMMQLYAYFVEGAERDSRFTDQNWESCQKYYDAVYREIEPLVTSEILAANYNNVIKAYYAGNKFDMMIPCMGIHEFLERLKEGREHGADKCSNKCEKCDIGSSQAG